MEPPVAKSVPQQLVVNGDVRVDPYAWLRNRNDPDTVAYLEAENRYTEDAMRDTGELQERLYGEIVGRIKQTDLSVPARHGNYFYYTRTEEGKQYPVYCRREGDIDVPEEVLLDCNAMAEGQHYFRLGVFEPSPDHTLLAYSIDLEGDEVYTVRVKDLATGELRPDSIPGTSASLAWASDNRTFFYTTLDPAKRPYRLYRHELGAAAGALLHEERDERFELTVSRTKSGGYVFLDISSHTTSEYRYLDAAAPGELRVLFPRRQDVEYDAVHHGGHFYVRINDSGRNFRFLKTPVPAPDAAGAEEVRPHRAEVFLEHVDAFANHLVLLERENGLREIAIEDLRNGERHRVSFPEPVYSVFPGANPEFETARFRHTYTSLVTPFSVFDYDMDGRTSELKKQTEVLGGYNPAEYASERLFATAPDGVCVPVSVVYRKGLVRDGRAPALLYGYGAYGHSTEAAFSSDRLSLLDRGFVFAMAHTRGGSEMGRPWYDNGKLLKKRNSFMDFIACAEALISSGFTSAGRLSATGGSAGGLLMGAVLNLRPDLFGAAIAKVPFVDVLNTMLDATLPLTVTEYEEWGNPNLPEYYHYIRGYSPYDNVERQPYPDMLITAGLNDPRVSYWEPAKWTAKLRAMNPDSGLLLLKTSMGAGHFGASGRYEKFRDTAFDYAFLLKTVGL